MSKLVDGDYSLEMYIEKVLDFVYDDELQGRRLIIKRCTFHNRQGSMQAYMKSAIFGSAVI
jgi:hypothetical protein